MASPQDVVQAQAMYDAYIAAELAILGGQSYTIGTRSLTKADLRSVIAERKMWGMTLDRLNAGRTGPSVLRAIPRDI